MADYIKRHDALNFELSVETDPIRIPAIREGMKIYAEYLKSLPTIDVPDKSVKVKVRKKRTMRTRKGRTDEDCSNQTF